MHNENQNVNKGAISIWVTGSSHLLSSSNSRKASVRICRETSFSNLPPSSKTQWMSDKFGVTRLFRAATRIMPCPLSIKYSRALGWNRTELIVEDRTISAMFLTILT